MTDVLVVRDVRKAFRDVVAVDGVSLAVREGEVFGLLGPNGAGKTTLIRMILDIYRPDEGEVEVFGHRLDRADLDRIGYLPEERGLYRRRKVIDILRYLGELKGLAGKAAVRSAERWLERLAMADARDKRIEALSKGNQQKIQLIGTLVAGPRLLVWDEPFSGLDPVNVRRVRDLMVELRKEGTTVLLSTHLMSQAESLCDRVGLISGGRLVLSGGVSELRDSLGQRLVEVELDQELGGDDPLVRTLEPMQPRFGRDWHRYCVLPAEGLGPGDLAAGLCAGGAKVAELHPRRPSLEEVFLHAVRR